MRNARNSNSHLISAHTVMKIEQIVSTPTKSENTNEIEIQKNDSKIEELKDKNDINTIDDKHDQSEIQNNFDESKPSTSNEITKDIIETKYKCLKCEKTFEKLNVLRSHMALSHKISPRFSLGTSNMDIDLVTKHLKKDNPTSSSKINSDKQKNERIKNFSVP